MDPEDISKTHFVPFSTVEKALDILENPLKGDYSLCKRNLSKVQRDKINPVRRKDKDYSRYTFQLALRRAIYSHDWDKVLYLLKKFPITEQYSTSKLQDKMHVYIRALTILLMYHPSAKAQELLHEYLHMVCTCRTDVEKKALIRLILTLPEKLIFKVEGRMRKYMWEQMED